MDLRTGKKQKKKESNVICQGLKGDILSSSFFVPFDPTTAFIRSPFDYAVQPAESKGRINAVVGFRAPLRSGYVVVPERSRRASGTAIVNRPLTKTNN
ncbi:MAG: hypothetical protein EAZ78_03285 [Oscillatoriales cyanobacterium]|nr:MAG: hypothetical protein EA000_03495 [Oscillatoriales cyanobacterium]TAD94604.1 MAG: hypothetical protein EAZ98_18650 [Oscillatoriales cyanobacterium]TAE03618.1 MAG: hypothetical protein EAZ96_12255 [Oscillatoriales cyanobacterium]TAF06223.1 MAG: hypothetical protein EAZ78_03285 [Oscillatoriales cyanobacterium]TAF36694.1 MAG: hypothetical protein EAZ68_16170 [Oscillatoriales cyanobacterium]